MRMDGRTKRRPAEHRTLRVVFGTVRMLVLLVSLVASFIGTPATGIALAADQIHSESPSPNPSPSPSIDPSPSPSSSMEPSPSLEPSPTPSESPPPGSDINGNDTSSIIVKTIAGLSPEEQQ